MNDEDVTELLDELRATIAQSEGLGDDDRDRLATLIGRIESEVDEDEDDDPNLLDHVSDAIGRFETEHVDLVATINRIANALSAGGI